MITPVDERPRQESTVKMLSLALTQLSSIVAECSGRLHRRAKDQHGRPLFAAGEVNGRPVWVCLPIAETIRILRALMPAEDCTCSAGCEQCHHAGYLAESPQSVDFSPTYSTLEYGSALDVWGWVRSNDLGPVDEPESFDEDDDVGEQLSLLDMLEEKA